MDIKQLRELEAKATEAPWDATPNPMRSDGKFLTHGPERPYVFLVDYLSKKRQFAEDRWFASFADGIFMGQGKPEDVDFLAALRNAAPYLFAVVEAAGPIEDVYSERCECNHDRGYRCIFCKFRTALSDFRSAK